MAGQGTIGLELLEQVCQFISNTFLNLFDFQMQQVTSKWGYRVQGKLAVVVNSVGLWEGEVANMSLPKPCQLTPKLSHFSCLMSLLQ